MTADVVNTVLLAGAFLCLFASAELLYHRFKVAAELTRKYVHISTGLLTLLFPPLIGNHWLVLALCGSFLVLLLGTMRFKLLKSVNAVDRATVGSLLYPVIVYGCYLAQEHFGGMGMYYIPILVLAVCDPVAALVGKRTGWLPFTVFGHRKTVAGSLAFFVSAFLLCLALMTFLEAMEVGHFRGWVALAVAAATTVAEAVVHKGYDNLSIPAVALGVMVVFSEMPL